MTTQSIPPTTQSPANDDVLEAQVIGDPEESVVDAELATPAAEPPQQLWLGRLLYAIEILAIGWEKLFGALSLMVGLALLATIPVFNLLSLGYLLEASGRVARTGKLRNGFIGVSKAYRVGAIVAGTWLMLLPLRLLSDIWYEASLIDPGSVNTLAWRIGLIVATVVILAHILLAWYAGGKLRHFLWPIVFPLMMVYGMLVWAHRQQVVHNQWPPPILLLQGLWRGDMYTAGRDAVWDFIIGLRLPHYFWLGLRGFVGALIWLFVPVSILIIAANLNEGAGAVFGFFGSLMLAVVVLYLPFMQAHFATENRFRAMFEWWTVRKHFRHAPIAFWFALLVTLLFAVPLYTLKVEVTPAEVTWLPALVFVAFIFPARLITGWALARARRRETPRHVLVRWLARFAAIPVVLTYVFFVYFSQYLSWYGTYSFLDQHAFLVPVPFLGI